METGFCTVETSERRRHKRFKVKDGALAFIGSVPGTIVDISEGGMTVRYVVLEKELNSPFQLDIFFGINDFYLPDVPGDVVNEGVDFPQPPFSAFYIKRLGIKFGELTSEQESQVKYFILNNTVSEA